MVVKTTQTEEHCGSVPEKWSKELATIAAALREMANDLEEYHQQMSDLYRGK